jgi:8-oxo-dGTP diphosphatase
VYAGIRKGSHGADTLALPGGHLELYESWEDCAIREVKEEMDVDLLNVELAHVTNNPMPDEEKHYVTIFMMGRIGNDAGEPVNTEPDKCEGWRLYEWDELQSMQDTGKLFGPLECLIKEAPIRLMEFISSSSTE